MFATESKVGLYLSPWPTAICNNLFNDRALWSVQSRSLHCVSINHMIRIILLIQAHRWVHRWHESWVVSISIWVTCDLLVFLINLFTSLAQSLFRYKSFADHHVWSWLIVIENIASMELSWYVYNAWIVTYQSMRLIHNELWCLSIRLVLCACQIELALQIFVTECHHVVIFLPYFCNRLFLNNKRRLSCTRMSNLVLALIIRSTFESMLVSLPHLLHQIDHFVLLFLHLFLGDLESALLYLETRLRKIALPWELVIAIFEGHLVIHERFIFAKLNLGVWHFDLCFFLNGYFLWDD